MTPEAQGPSQLVTDLLDAAGAEDWDKVDNELVPQLHGVDGNLMTDLLLDHVGDEKPDIRDVVATSLYPLNISDDRTRERAIEAMVKMATTDTEVFPAGRATAFLRKHQKGREDIGRALDEFKQRAVQEGWLADLTENIPALENFF